MKPLADWTARHPRAAVLALGAAMLALAYANRFVQDDAFIVFRYAENLVRGRGLVFNPGEPVEGYSCFLYTLVMAGALKLGFEPVAFSQVFGLACYAGTLAGIVRLGRVASGSRGVGLLAMGLAGSLYSFSIYATGGLETSLLTGLVTWTLALAIGEGRAAQASLGRRAWVSLLAALALMTRLDAALLLAPAVLRLVVGPKPRGVEGAVTAGAMARVAVLLPAAALLGAWFAWKLSYYGTVLPSTFYAKATGGWGFGAGALYLYRFVDSYWLAPALLLAAWGARSVLEGPALRLLLPALALLVLYVLRIGGDFMEFRMLVPAIPILALVLARTAAWLERRAGLGAALVAMVLAGSLHHAVTFNRTSHHGTESVWHLTSHLYQGDQNWTGIGDVLRREFGADTGFVISTTAAGAIPYYSRAFTVDQLGLTDLEVARHGIVAPDRMPGHRRMASMDHLIARRVNLVIGHPRLYREALPDTIYREDYAVPRWLAGERHGTPVPPGLRAVEIPIEEGWRLLALYLTPRASVDSAIARHGWRVHPVASRSTVAR